MHARIALAVTLTLLLYTVCMDAVSAEKRVALVIGNSAYVHAPVLPNPKNDARGMTAELSRLGFDVVSGIDLNRVGMQNAIIEFEQKLSGSELAVFYYAGHALQVDQRNYLVPVDAQLPTETHLHFEAVDVQLILGAMQQPNRPSIVFLDACRDNPLARNLRRSMGSTRSQALGRGLAKMEAGVGTLVAFATNPGNVALDGEGAHSPFTAALLEYVGTPGLDVQLMIRRVRQSVVKATNGIQVPWDNSSLTGAVYMAPKYPAQPIGDAATVAAEPQGEPKHVPPPSRSSSTIDMQIQLSHWNSIKDSRDLNLFQDYLNRWPDGHFSALARSNVDELIAPKADPVRDTGTLTVTSDPPGARVRILNIKPRYHDGISLDPGSYHIEVSKSGYRTHKEWIKVDPVDVTHRVTLKKGQPAPKVKKKKRRKKTYSASAHCSITGATGWASGRSSSKSALNAAINDCIRKGGVPACCRVGASLR